jgi:hypothetical protein
VKEKGQLQDLGLKGRIILKYILVEKDKRMNYFGTRQGAAACSCVHGIEP